MPIIFQNDGELDPRLVTTLGTNVKENENAIGYFGTGLKYAICTLLRCEQEIVIYSGENKYEFRVEPTEIRGKLFGLVQYSRDGGEWQTMNITTELGKNWELWMAFRELYTNALDENGYVLDDVPVPMPGTTVVSVEGERFRDVYETRWSYFINPARKPIYKDDRVEIYEGSNPRAFYRGIAVYKPHYPMAFTYNVLSHCNLTEDRTTTDFELFFQIHHSIKELHDEEMTRRYLSISPGYLENEIGWFGGPTSKEFGKLFRKVWAKCPQNINPNIKSRVEKDSHMDESEMTDVLLTPAQDQKLRNALKIAQYVGLEVERNRVRVVNEITGASRLIGRKLYFSIEHVNGPDFIPCFLMSCAGLAVDTKGEAYILAVRLNELAERLWQFENQGN